MARHSNPRPDRLDRTLQRTSDPSFFGCRQHRRRPACPLFRMVDRNRSTLAFPHRADPSSARSGHGIGSQALIRRRCIRPHGSAARRRTHFTRTYASAFPSLSARPAGTHSGDRGALRLGDQPGAAPPGRLRPGSIHLHLSRLGGDIPGSLVCAGAPGLCPGR